MEGMIGVEPTFEGFADPAVTIPAHIPKLVLVFCVSGKLTNPAAAAHPTFRPGGDRDTEHEARVGLS